MRFQIDLLNNHSQQLTWWSFYEWNKLNSLIFQILWVWKKQNNMINLWINNILSCACIQINYAYHVTILIFPILILYTWIVEPHPNHKGIYFLAITIVLFQFISFHYFCFCEYRISFLKRDRLPWSFLDYFYLLKQKNSVCIRLKHLNSRSLHKNSNNFATI